MTLTAPPRPTALLLSLPLLAAMFASCSSTKLRTEADPSLEKRAENQQVVDADRRKFEQVLIKLDQGMDSYVTALANRGDPRADKQIERIGNLLRNLVLDQEAIPTGADPNAYEVGANFRQLKAIAADASVPRQQGIALAALGFSGRPDCVNLIAQGTMSDDPEVIDKAVLGLAILRAPQTPIGPLAAIVESERHPQDGRVQAAWAMYQVQGVLTDPAQVVECWRRFLTTEKQKLPAGVLVTAIRGLGLTGNAQHADLVAPLLQHPVPRMRMAAALALGRMNAQDHWKDLLKLLEPAETVQNVRLHARKALAALAGNKDYGYDVTAWQNVFERGDKTDKE